MLSIVQRLRQATQPAHAELERRVDFLRQVAAPDGRGRLVRRFYAMHAAAEAALHPWLADVPDLDFAGRSRIPRLREDLAALGVPRGEPAPAPRFSSRGAAMGGFYVLEGSTLGGHVLRRSLTDLTGLGFLDPYGDDTGLRWRQVLQVLEREARSRGAADAMVGSAVGTFAWVAEALCPQATAA